jgi:hypothetical protein
MSILVHTGVHTSTQQHVGKHIPAYSNMSLGQAPHMGCMHQQRSVGVGKHSFPPLSPCLEGLPGGSWPHSPQQAINKTYCVPDIVLSTGNRAENKTDISLPSLSFNWYNKVLSLVYR